MYWIIEFGEEEGLLRAIDEKLDGLNFETESGVSEVPWQGRRASGPLQGFSSANRKGRSLLFHFEDQVDWEFTKCMADLLWRNGIFVCKGKAWGESVDHPPWEGGEGGFQSWFGWVAGGGFQW